MAELDNIPEIPIEKAGATDKRKPVFSMAFAKGTLTMSSAMEEEDFWIEIPPSIGWIRFKKLWVEHESKTRYSALFQAIELRSALEPAPDQIFSLQCVLWRRQEAIEAEKVISSYLQSWQTMTE